MLTKVTVIKYVTETLILLLYAHICDIGVSISDFNQTLRKKESQTRQGFNFTGIQFHNFLVLELFAGTKFRENGQKLQKWRHLIPTKLNTFKVNHILYFSNFHINI